MKFYFVTGKTKTELLELYEQHKATFKRRNAFIKRHDAKGSVTNGNQFAGLVFKGPPPPPWRTVKSAIAGHTKPDNTNAGKALRAEMVDLADYSWIEVARITGVQAWRPGSFSIPDFRVWTGNVVVFGADDQETPNKDCRRISDVQYEQMLKKEQTRRLKTKAEKE